MGKGDKRSRKGKIWRGSFGKTRPQKDKTKPKFVPKPKPKRVVAPVVPEETLMEVPAIEGAEVKAAKPKKAAAPKKPKADRVSAEASAAAQGEKKTPAKPKKKAAEASASPAESAPEGKKEE